MKHWADKYDKIEQIGQGASGKIFKIMRKDNKQIMAAKVIIIDKEKDEFSNIELEVKIMSSCSHKNIIECLGVQLFAGQVWILMQYCENGSLSDLMKQRRTVLTQGQIREIMRQVLEGLCYLHENSIVHRDIKASNLLYHHGVVKIADFGVSFIKNMDKLLESKFNRIGSPYWMSPEVLSDSIYNEKTDIWALGITAIELAEGEPPFSHQHPFRAIYSIQTHPPQGIKTPNTYTPEFNNFIKECLTLDHIKRPTSKDLLKHPFLSNIQYTESLLNSPISQRLQNEQGQNTIIMYDDIPKSIWQKESYPQSEAKQKKECNNTVIIKESSIKENNFQFCNQFSSIVKEKDKIITVKNVMSMEERELQVEQLYAKMQLQIKQVRRRYMQRIKGLYHDQNLGNKENNLQNSAPNRPKQKNKVQMYPSNALINAMNR